MALDETAYATPARLLESVDVRELAQASTPAEESVVEADLLRATINGDDRSEWTSAEQAVADEALANIEAACDRAARELEGYVGSRFDLPLSTIPGVLHERAVDMARFRLHRDVPPENVETLYRDAIKYLDAVAQGRIRLVVEDQTTADSGQPDSAGPDTVFSADNDDAALQLDSQFVCL